MNDMYVDDLLTGSQDAKTLTLICQRLINIFNQAGFTLRKLSSNDRDVLNNLPQIEETTTNDVISNDQNTKTLGVSWNSVRSL